MSDNKVRLIDANALMQRICGKECGQHFKECHLEGDDTRCVFRDYVQSEPTIEAEPVGWISVKDEMPKLGERVMAFCRAGILTFLRYDGKVWFEMSSRNEYLLSFVTHWRPLPKPPKGE